MIQLTSTEVEKLSKQDRSHYDRAGWKRTTVEIKTMRHRKRCNKIARLSRRKNR